MLSRPEQCLAGLSLWGTQRFKSVQMAISLKINKKIILMMALKFIVPGIILVIPLLFISCKESVHIKRIPSATEEILLKDFMFSEILELAKINKQNSSSMEIFTDNPNHFKLIYSGNQGDLKVQGYAVSDPKSPIIGYSLYFHKDGLLIMIDTTINPFNKVAIAKSKNLISKSFKSTKASKGSKLHFLGIYDIDLERELKIMIRDVEEGPNQEIALRYAISWK